VLESKHVIGIFLFMMVLSGVFFTLGYLMGRQQFDSEVRAAPTGRSAFDEIMPKPNAAAKRADKTATPAKPTETAVPPNSDWEFYNAGKPKTTEDHLKPADPATSHKTLPAVAKTGRPATPIAASSKSLAPSKSLNGLPPASGAYTLQVAALTREADAMDLATRLQKKKFPAVVLTPQADKFYRVQVGPYPDQKSADAAKKGLEAEGFKAFVKH